jgi:hypothetical protein
MKQEVVNSAPWLEEFPVLGNLPPTAAAAALQGDVP